MTDDARIQEYLAQAEAGEHLWDALVGGKFNASFAAMWRPASIREALYDDYQIHISDEAGKDLYLVLAPMIADIMEEANERVAERMIEILAEFADKADNCPPELL